MSALSAIEAAVVDGPELAAPLMPPQRRALRLVGRPEADGLTRGDIPRDDPAEPRFSSIRQVPRASAGGAVLTPSAVISPRPRAAAGSAPLRLTRRGRAAVAVLVVALIAGLALAIAMVAAGGAQAASPGQPGGAHRGMHEIVVQPGQTLWSLASAAEPTADPRLVVQQIMAVNRLTNADIAAGQLLWVPR